MNTVILASASPRRKQLFEMMGIACTVDPSDADEIIQPNHSPSENVCRLAELKAADVAKRHTNSIVIAADTIVVKEGKILGKPKSSGEAADMLRSLGGDHHFVYSGVSVILTADSELKEQLITFSEKTKVTFSPLDEPEIKKYIATGSPMDKAGAYGIQDDYGSLFIKKVEGDYYNVVGFPVNKFYQKLKSDHQAIFKKIFSL